MIACPGEPRGLPGKQHFFRRLFSPCVFCLCQLRTISVPAPDFSPGERVFKPADNASSRKETGL